MKIINQIPATIWEGIDLICDSLDETDKQYIRENTPSTVHFGYGMYLRNTWKLWVAESPIVIAFKKEFEIFGHADDISGAILEGVWAKVNGVDPKTAVHISVRNAKTHWKKTGVDILTGEKVE